MAATSSVRVLRGVVAMLSDPKPLLAELGIDAKKLDDEEARVPFSLLQKAWTIAARVAGDEAFGLHFAEALSIGQFDVLDYVARSCATLLAAFERLARYQRLLHDNVVITLEQTGEGVWVRHRLAGDLRSVTRHAAEAVLASWVLRARQLTGAPIRPELIHFHHPQPADLREHRRILGWRMKFGCDENALLWTEEQMSLPLLSADSGLCALLDRHAEQVLARMPVDGFLGSVRAAVAQSMRGSSPSVDEVARRLHLSRRSLQRRLAEENQSFSDIVQMLRRELALKYVGESEVALGEVAFLVGFSEPSAFSRAFRRWAGCTPLEYREQRRATHKKSNP